MLLLNEALLACDCTVYGRKTESCVSFTVKAHPVVTTSHPVKRQCIVTSKLCVKKQVHHRQVFVLTSFIKLDICNTRLRGHVVAKDLK